MRKQYWCCAAAGVLAAGGMFTAFYHATRHPDTVFGRCAAVAAGTSALLQPAGALGPVVARAVGHPAAAPTAAAHDCIPDEPRPVEPAPAVAPLDAEAERPAEPIVIDEAEAAPQAEALPMPSTMDLDGPPARAPVEVCQDQAEQPACPMVMPYCTEGEEETSPPPMPYAAEGEPGRKCHTGEKDILGILKKPSGESPEDGTSSPSSEPKCQEDGHHHEHYSGCPYTGCNPSGRTLPSCTPAHSGKEESSEEPPATPKKHGKKHGKGQKGGCMPTEGVDTMEYRRSDGGLNEYGPGPF